MITLASILLSATSINHDGLMLICLVILGMIAIAFTPYRYVIGYFVVGMMYWIWVEGLHWLVVHLSNLTDVNAYVAAIALSLLPLAILLNWKPRNTIKPLKHDKSQLSAGHRPIVLEEDTDYHQNFVRHSSVFDSEH